MNELRKIALVGAIISLSLTSFSQIDTTKIDSSLYVRPIKNLQSIEVIRPNLLEFVVLDLRETQTILFEKDIQELATDDAGSLLSKLSGVTVKSYGGLGAMKSVSVRSMGSQHTALVMDGFVYSNAQSGQMNLAQIQTDGVFFATASAGSTRSAMIPVSAETSGSAIFLRTFMSNYSNDKLQLRSNIKYGSFNRQEAYFAIKRKFKERLTIATFGKFRRADGDYKYSYLNGNQEVDATRMNNDYLDYYYGAQATISGEKFDWLRIGYRGMGADQGLPGAVILYNETADERLNSEDHALFGDLMWRVRDLNFRAYTTFNLNNTNYFDPSYFNNAGFLDIAYQNQTGTVGMVSSNVPRNRLAYRTGVEHTISALSASDSSLSNPLRNHTQIFFAGIHNWSIGRLELKVSSQYVIEKTRAADLGSETFKVNPSVEFKTRAFKRQRMKHGVWYKNTFRLPSFNELYYNQTGNTDLLPESAHQVNYGFEAVLFQRNFTSFYARTNLFYNRVQNKIVAIPTKNLFVWSMQNVENVNIYGAEFIFDFKFRIKELPFAMSGNYSYQKALDVTEGSLNYGDQIAYTPEHMANLDLSVKLWKFGVRLSNNFVSGRYALNENIDQNLVDAYVTSDVAVHYQIQLKKQNFLKIQANVKNVFNHQYAYIKSFAMPGRNYLITLSYALN